MIHAAFFVAVTLACLAFTATCTAAAARTGNDRWSRILLGVGIGLPLLVCAICLRVAFYLAYRQGMEPNWCGPVFAMTLVAAFGARLVLAASGIPASAAHGPAEAWPLMPLLGIFLGASGTACGLIVALDHAVAAEAAAMRAEAAALMLDTMTAPANPDHDAAPLHASIAAALAADPLLTDPGGLLATAIPGNGDPAVDDLLTRHAETLDRIRRAADRPFCRFDGDWTRPRIDSLLPAALPMKKECQLLALAAEREVERGQYAAAIADIGRIGRLSRQAAGESFLVWQQVAWAIESTAIGPLVRVLPKLEPADEHLLEAPGIRDLLAGTGFPARGLVAEEAVLLVLYAGVADGRVSLLNPDLEAVGTIPSMPASPFEVVAALPVLLHRVFYLPTEIAGFRATFRRVRRLVESKADQPGEGPGLIAGLSDIGADVTAGKSGGLLLKTMLPAFDQAFRRRTTAAARRTAAAILVAATRSRLTTGALPESLEALVPAFLPDPPIDPFTAGLPMRLAIDGEDLVVWSVGPDRVDQGGPRDPVDEESEEFPPSDDIGLRMKLAATP